MSKNILVTGAAGYIGGSVLADFIARSSGPIKATNISATVRTEEQVQALSKLGVNVIQADLSDEKAVTEAVLRNEIDIVVHAASSIESQFASNLIQALGQRRKVSGAETYIIHSSVINIYTKEAGWQSGEVRDSDSFVEKEKEIEGYNPARQTNIVVNEQAKAQGVTSFIIPIPHVYGTGTGEWRKLSVNIPTFVRCSVKHKAVYKFDTDARPAAVHISDLTELYALIVEKILQNEPIPSGEKGYYFAMAHRSPWWATMDRIAKSLFERKLVLEPHAQVWSSDEMAAEYLGYPIQFVRIMGTASGEFVPVNPFKLGWQPKWDEERYLGIIEDEVRDALELDTLKATVFSGIRPADN